MSKIVSIILFTMCNLSLFAADYKSGSDNAFIFSWTNDDSPGIYTAMGSRIQHWVESIDNDAHYAKFTSRAWGLSPNFDYYAYYPYSSYYYEHECPITALPVSYENQKQSGNGSVKHLSAYDFMIASGKTTATTADFTMKHLGSVLRIQLQVPQDKATLVPTAIKLSLQNTVAIATSANMNLPEQNMVPSATARELTLQLENVILGSDNTITAYMMIPPFSCPNEYPTVTLYSGSLVMTSIQLLTKEFSEGYCYTAIHTTAAKERNNGSTATTSIQSSLQYPVLYAPDFKPVTVSAATGILLPTATEQTTTSDRFFTIDGRMLPTPNAHGVIIKNGKKYITK